MMIRRLFTLESVVTVPGFSDGTTWNGFPIPFFEEPEARRVAERTNTPLPTGVVCMTEQGVKVLFSMGGLKWAWQFAGELEGGE